MIRAVLHLDPTSLSDEEWIYEIANANWMFEHRIYRFAKVIKNALGG